VREFLSENQGEQQCQSMDDREAVLSWLSNSDFLAARSGVELSDKIVEVIIKNTHFQYERS
jgi:hypothetical protein